MRFSQFCSAVSLLGLAALPAQADNLLKNASFEQPQIKGRLPEVKGGNPARTDKETTWIHFESLDRQGRISIGMTDEIARTGKQSIYVDFRGAAKTRDALLISDAISIMPGATYRVSIWGRMDAKRPLTLVHGRPMLRLEVEFFLADQETQTGDTEYRTQLIPGSARRLLFVPGNWNEYHTEVEAPADAALMKITFRWEPPGEKGDADGLIFFDDAVVEGPAGPPIPNLPDATDSPSAPAKPAGAAANPIPPPPSK